MGWLAASCRQWLKRKVKAGRQHVALSKRRRGGRPLNNAPNPHTLAFKLLPGTSLYCFVLLVPQVWKVLMDGVHPMACRAVQLGRGPKAQAAFMKASCTSVLRA